MSVLKLAFFHSKNVTPQKAGEVRDMMITATNKFLKNQKITVDAYPAKGALEIDYSETIVESASTQKGKEQRNLIRWYAHMVYPNGNGRLPIIICRLQKGAGEAPGSLGLASNWLPYVLVDAVNCNKDGLTMLHEIGHCAGLRHPGDDPKIPAQDEDNLMSYGGNGAFFDPLPRSVLQDYQLKAIKNSYFHC